MVRVKNLVSELTTVATGDWLLVEEASGNLSKRATRENLIASQANSTAGTIAANGTQAAGTSKLYARADHVHPTDTTRAPLASPTFTGTPAAPTPAADTNTTQLATTAYVIGQAGAANPVMNGAVAVGTSLRYSRQDHVHPTDTTRAPLASPTFTGTVTLPGQRLAIRTATQDTTITATDSVVLADATSNNVVVTLPTAVGITGQIYRIKRIDAEMMNQVTITPQQGETLDGLPDLAPMPNQPVTLISNGTNWFILA